MNVLVFSTKRSTHHAFLECFLRNRYYYENDYKFKGGCLVPARVEGDVKFKDELHVASFEFGYQLPNLLNDQVFLSKFPLWEEHQKIVYMRDPLNTLSSILSVYYNPINPNKKHQESWVYRNINHWVNLFEFSKNIDLPCFKFVYANEFWRNDEYKKSLQELFGRKVEVVNHVSTLAGGGKTFFSDQNYSSNNLEGRYLKFAGDPLFRAVVADNVGKFREFLNLHEEREMIHFIESL